MLSVLSSSAVHLSEELHRTRQDLVAARCEAAQLAAALQQKRTWVVQHMESVFKVLQQRNERLLQSLAFHGMIMARSCSQVWRRSASAGLAESPAPSSPRRSPGRATAWQWLWQKKVFGLWRRGAEVARRARHSEEHHAELHGQRASLLDLEECVERLHGRRVDLEALLQSERRRVQELETELSGCKEQVKELQRTLKESYVQQFEASQKREELESHFSKLLEELHRMKADKEGLEGQIPQLRKDLKEARALNADQESQLVEATGELSLAEEVIDDITSSKLVGLRRFFEHYNLPAVCLSLFRKVVELQHQLRTRSRLSQTSQASETPRSPRLERTRAIESEVRQLGAVTRCSLQGYIEGLNVDQVTSSMVVQVVLALLGLDLGRAPCDAARFVSLLAAPPAWEQLDFATALWGSAGEPAAAVVQQHRARLAALSSQGSASTCKLSPRHGSLEERRRDQGVGCRA
ncbi:spnA [Symbiodinium necroappetens]|uniref:SpnA protein n=1 Tax=Symbiodinium necroappetens TaxID=1628268 RepID=A0A813BRW1_9DINO|nr:spnA [Symbiodinium necroappetens]